MKFKKEDLIEKMYTDDVIKDDVVENTRWSIIHEWVFRHEGKFYESTYSCGATESQDESPYEYDDDEIECPEVELREVTVKKWMPV